MKDIINEHLLGQVKDHIQKKDRSALKKIIDEMRPADVADLIEHLNPDERLYIFELVEPEGAGEILVEIEPPVQEHLLNRLDNEVISEIVHGLDSDVQVGSQEHDTRGRRRRQNSNADRDATVKAHTRGRYGTLNRGLKFQAEAPLVCRRQSAGQSVILILQWVVVGTLWPNCNT